MIRRSLIALLALALTGGLLAPPSGAEGPDPHRAGPRIIGGSESAPGQWPWQAAILGAGTADTHRAFFCGGTVIGHSWVLTAAHCVANLTPAAARSDIDVLVGTNILGDGSGHRLPVAGLHVNPNFDRASSQNDVALLRLAQPTNARSIPVVTPSQAALWAPGTVATVSGWGNMSVDPAVGVYPTHLRHATIPIQSDATCAQKYPPGRVDPGSGASLTFVAASMVCAGPLAGGRDTCNGDSGGPLMVPGPGAAGWVEVGITSWGYGCAKPDNPGVYSRLGAASMAGFVSQTVRFGPYDDDASFITRQFLDFNDRRPSAAELAGWRNLLAKNAPRDLIATLESSRTWHDHGWAIARLFSAFFLRDPDTGGLAYWTDRSFRGEQLASVAASFARSSEFTRRYGAINNAAFVDLVYRNVLKRTPDPRGRAYWAARLSAGLPRGSMMVGFSESDEYRSRTESRVRAITTWFGLIRKVPSAAQTVAAQAEPLATLIDSLRDSFSYALRF